MLEVYKFMYKYRVAILCLNISIVIGIIYYEFVPENKPWFWSYFQLAIIPLIIIFLLLYDRNKKKIDRN